MEELTDDVRSFLGQVPTVPFGPLTPDAAVKATEALRAGTPLAEAMGLVVLNDTDDSNHYCLITRGPGAGAVVFLPHDDGPGFAFPDLATLRDVMTKAAADGAEIWDVASAPPAPHPDQQPLRDHLRAVLAGDRSDAAAVVGMLLPLLEPDDIDTLRLTATDSDFLIRESAARFMAAVPRAAQIPLLQTLAGDKYAQVKRPAREALDALNGSP